MMVENRPSRRLITFGSHPPGLLAVTDKEVRKMRISILEGTKMFLMLTIGSALTIFGVPQASAQQKHQIAYKTLGENTQYTQQHAIDVGDIPGHQVRINEIHTVFPKDAPMFEGVRVVESWMRGYSDYVDINGRHWGYGILILENGDKIFTRNDGSSQTIVGADGAKKSTATGVTTLTGGTGKFRGIHGTLRYVTNFDPKTGLNEGRTEGAYWLED
jgi:hypothetical protein